MKFHFVDDQKRALVSRLLQRRACFEATAVPYDQVQIERTKGGKPFMANKPPASPAPSGAADGGSSSGGAARGPNWNFNVSHEGRYVALATESTMVCGVDVAAPEAARPGRKKRSVDENLKMMVGQLTASEMATIESARPHEQEMEDVRPSLADGMLIAY